MESKYNDGYSQGFTKGYELGANMVTTKEKSTITEDDLQRGKLSFLFYGIAIGTIFITFLNLLMFG